ncbi:MAG TPA: nitroreductase family protein [Actinomycetota bacterium]|nr:nitroreductase family protein [Actinomycetota bacterium]
MLELTTDELLTTTRAVRKRLDLDRPVPREMIEECLDLAIQAPTGSNAQGWRWVVLTDPERKARVAEAYRRSWEPYAAQGRDNLAKLEGERAVQMERVVSSSQYLADNLHRVPVLVIPCVLGRLPAGAPEWMWTGLLASIYPAVWSFHLALRSRGLGSTLTTLHVAYADEVAEVLGIPDTVTQAALLPVAYTKGTRFRRAARRPVSEITYWEGWKG